MHNQSQTELMHFCRTQSRKQSCASRIFNEESGDGRIKNVIMRLGLWTLFIFWRSNVYVHMYEDVINEEERCGGGRVRTLHNFHNRYRVGVYVHKYKCTYIYLFMQSIQMLRRTLDFVTKVRFMRRKNVRKSEREYSIAI
ncbi:Hypothetical predicted protein [Drosophila guanche]|uniref:Uncharacterized protein n=1 Tax=Drosophila guanche TaxID=7266 RepID=A0A3B0JKV6_DROGU|nr:Hypothetical predicted protein [Drosophila guanche]